MIDTQRDIYVVTHVGGGSTLLCNRLYGLFIPDRPVIYKFKVPRKIPTSKARLVIVKTHDYTAMSFDNCYKVTINRPEITRKTLDKYRDDDTVLTINYTDLLYNTSYTPHIETTRVDVINHVARELHNRFNIEVSAEQIDQCEKRLQDMDATVARLEKEPFARYNNMYHVHGSHRNRSKK